MCDSTDLESLRRAHSESSVESVKLFRQKAMFDSSPLFDEFMMRLQISLDKRFKKREDDVLKSMEENRRLRRMQTVQLRMMGFHHSAYETIQNLASQLVPRDQALERLMEMSREFVQQLAHRSNDEYPELDADAIRCIEEQIPATIDEQMKIYEPLKETAKQQLVSHSLSTYNAQMTEFLKQVKDGSVVTPFETNHLKLVGHIMANMDAKIGHSENDEIQCVIKDINQHIEGKRRDFEEKFSWINKSYFGRVNDILIEKKLSHYQSCVEKESIPQNESKLWESFHEKTVQSLLADIDAEFRGTPDMRMEYKKILQERLDKLYHEIHPPPRENTNKAVASTSSNRGNPRRKPHLVTIVRRQVTREISRVGRRLIKFKF